MAALYWPAPGGT